MKKLFALLLAVAMMATMMTSAMAAYTAITPATTTIQHSLQLTEETATGLLYDIVYSYAVGAPEILDAAANGIISGSETGAVKGSPSIASITYGPTDAFATNKTETKDLVIDWSGVEITQPGAYRWEVTQSVATAAPASDKAPSNAAETFYLFVYVIDNNGTLQSSVVVSKSDTATNDNKTTTLPETYPAKTVDLEISKTVAGNQGSKEQYFPFTVTLVAPNADKMAKTTYELSGNYDVTVPATAYNAGTTNLTEVTVENGNAEFTIWLKHGQSVTINDMVYGTDYTIVEGGNAGYTVSAAVTGADNSGKFEGYTTKDESLTDNAIVSYTNTKSAEVPTGIVLQSGASFAGIILAMGLMIMMLIGKRKEQNI